jgi:subtilisin family serine protease
MLTSLRTTAILLGMCGLLSACGERLEPGTPPTPQARGQAQGLGAQAGGKLLLAGVNGIPNRYIVVFDELAKSAPRPSKQEIRRASDELTRVHGGAVRRLFSSALRGFSVTMTQEEALAMSQDPRVRYVEQDRVVTLHSGTQAQPPSWGLDRVDQRYLELDNSYRYEYTGAGVHAYIFDTGVRSTHVEFAGRMGPGYDGVQDGNGTEDCHGHGTHVAGTVGGTRYGVAKNVTIHPIRVIGCQGEGTEESLISGIDWVVANHDRAVMGPAVGNMSLGTTAHQGVDDAVAAAISAGIVFVASAGNDMSDSCGKSPARVPGALTVGATDVYDTRAFYSNYGTCVDLFAPGSDIVSAWYTSDTAQYTSSGTSMAAPHVAGAVALYLQGHPNATPAEVHEELVARSTRNLVEDPGAGSPTVLLHSYCMGSNDSVKPSVELTSPAAGATVVGRLTMSATATDDVAISKVEFFVGGLLVAVDSTAPFQSVWDTTNVGNGTYTVTARAFDAGCNSRSASVSILINNPGQAAYDVALGAPACAELASVCDSVDLLAGRGAMGPEQNAPNTLGSSCMDGDEGYYELDPSLERIKVVREDGTALASGKRVRVDVSVLAGFDATKERLDLYSAADAQAPVWNLVASMGPLDVGYNVLSTTFILPQGGTRQALRGVYRYGAAVGTCGTGIMNDYDDLVFPVSQEPDTQAPVATLTAPAAGAILKNTVTLTATASDNFGVTHVEFYDGATLLATDTTAPYSYAWDTRTAANGTRSLTARAYDAAGLAGTSPGVSVTLDNDLIPPAVSFTAPAEGATVSGSVSVTASATDNVGVTKVEFYEGTTRLATDTASPYSFSWATRNVPNGTRTLTAKAYDAVGNIGTAQRTVIVDNDSIAPTVTLTAPSEGAVLSGTVTFSATASDDKGVSRVAFFVGTSQVGSDSTAPFTFSYNTRNMANGAKVITAKAYDAAANMGTSQAVNVTFDNDLTAPTTSITSPTSGSTVSGVTVIQAVASDDRGVITKVDFYFGNTLLGSDTTAPYSWNWDTTKFSTGTFYLKSRAVDAAGNAAFSANVSVTVTR